jgi:hypothetical protein
MSASIAIQAQVMDVSSVTNQIHLSIYQIGYVILFVKIIKWLSTDMNQTKCVKVKYILLGMFSLFKLYFE